MTEETRALQAFLSGFGARVYAEWDAPPDAEGLYITWTPLGPGRWEGNDLNVRLWRRGADLRPLAALADAMIAAVGAGRRLPLSGGGALVLWPGEPAAAVEPRKPGEGCVRMRLTARRI